MLIDWYLVTINQLQKFWQGFLIFLPKLFGALIILLIGWFISIGVEKLVVEILKRIKFNRIFERGTWKEALKKAEFEIDISSFIGRVVKWVLMIVFLLAVVEILGFVKFADFLTNVLNYLPNVIVAVLIFVVTVIISDIGERITKAIVESAKVGHGQLAGAIVKWSIWVFAILAILQQLKFEIADEIFGLIEIVFIGIVAIGAIAFGLGGKEIAAEILEGLKKKLKK